MGGQENKVTVVKADSAEDWPRMSKTAVSDRLAAEIAAALAG
jgi:phosphopantothenoylcysteine decarboxylase/phosphopantothenate--cysteine ligase